MERLIILVGCTNQIFFQVPLVGRFMPLVSLICWHNSRNNTNKGDSSTNMCDDGSLDPIRIVGILPEVGGNPHLILWSHTTKGPATRCDATHPRRNVRKPLRCIKIKCDALRCIFQHVGNFAPDGSISQLITVQFSNGFQYYDGHFTSFHLTFSVRYF